MYASRVLVDEGAQAIGVPASHVRAGLPIRLACRAYRACARYGRQPPLCPGGIRGRRIII